MSTKRRSRSRSRSGAPKRMTWVNAQTAPTVVANGVTATSDLMSGLGAGLEGRRGMKLLRIIGALRVNSTDPTLSVDFVGSIYLSQIGQSISPSTLAFPFLWWIRGSALPAAGPMRPWDIDVKGQRKLTFANSAIIFGIENNDLTQSLEFVFGLRLLVQLP